MDIGTYLGDSTKEVDNLMEEAVYSTVLKGINVIGSIVKLNRLRTTYKPLLILCAKFHRCTKIRYVHKLSRHEVRKGYWQVIIIHFLYIITSHIFRY